MTTHTRIAVATLALATAATAIVTADGATARTTTTVPVAHVVNVPVRGFVVDRNLHEIAAPLLPSSGAWTEALVADVYVHDSSDNGSPVYNRSVYVRCDLRNAGGGTVTYSDATAITDSLGNAFVALPLDGAVKATSTRRTTLLCRVDHNSLDMGHITWSASARVHGVAAKVNALV